MYRLNRLSSLSSNNIPNEDSPNVPRRKFESVPDIHSCGSSKSSYPARYFVPRVRGEQIPYRQRGQASRRSQKKKNLRANNSRRRRVGRNLSDAALYADILKRFARNNVPLPNREEQQIPTPTQARKRKVSMLKNPCHRILGETGSWSPQLKLNKSVSDEPQEPSRDGRMTRSLKVKRWVEDKKTNEQGYGKERPKGKHFSGGSQDRYQIAKAAQKIKDSSMANLDRAINRMSEFSSAKARRQQWLSTFEFSSISSDSSCSEELTVGDQDFTINSDIFNCLENPKEVKQRRLNAIKDKLSSKGQSFEIIDLLAAKKEKELLELIHSHHTRVVLDVCLLWSCIHGDKTLITYFLKLGANPDATDAEGFSAMHLVAENNNDEAVDALIMAGARIIGPSIWDNKKEVTPIMLAARAGNASTLEAMIAQGADVNCGLNTPKDVALHYAVRSQSIECLKILLAAGAMPNSLILYSESPLHIAASEGYVEMAQILLEAGADVRASRGSFRMAALHLAAQEGHSQIVKMLLDAGADHKQTNSRGQTALHLAARAQSGDTVQELLKRRADPNARDQDGKTPLHAGIFKGSRCYECLKILVEANADPNAADIAGYTPLHLAALHDSSYCVQMFLRHGGDVSARTKGGMSALNVILRKTPLGLICLQEILDSSIVQEDRDHHREGDAQMQLDFRIFKGEKGREPECRLLTCFVKERQRMLLKHPLCESFLYLKWQQVRSFFVVNIVFYSFLVMALTTFIHWTFPGTCFCEILIFQHTNNSSAPVCPVISGSPDSPRSPEVLGVTDKTIFNETLNATVTETFNENSLNEESVDLEFVKFFLLYFIWSLLGALTFKEVIQFVDTPRTYISSLDNLLVWPIILFTFSITVAGYLRDTREEWEYHIAAYLLLLSWIELLLLVGRFPLCGLYVQMFARVIQNFGKFLLTYICLINAFSLSFGVLFHNHSAFKCHLLRLLKTLVMMTGEVEYDEFFFDDPEILYPGTAHIIFAFFLVFCIIILMNLLVGLAVSDIQGLQQSAGLDRLVRQTQLIASLEMILFSRWLSLTIPPSVLKVIRNRVLLLPSMYGSKLSLATKNINGFKLESELLESIHRVARARDHGSRRRNAFASFRSMSHAAQYGSESETSRSIEALHCGLELLVRESEARKTEAKQIKESVITIIQQLQELLTRSAPSEKDESRRCTPCILSEVEENE